MVIRDQKSRKDLDLILWEPPDYEMELFSNDQIGSVKQVITHNTIP